MQLPDPSQIQAAYTRLLSGAYIRQTPLIDLGFIHGAHVIAKLEHLQVSGSFKTRGAFNTLLSQPIPAAGVVAASGGNHGLAVATAAARLNIPARIFVPQTAPAFKVRALQATGATIEQTGENYAAALAASQQWQAQSGALPLHAYDQVSILEGQGTCALELEQQLAQLNKPLPDTILIATGGGGFIGGMAAWLRGRCKVVAVEPEGSPTLHQAIAAGAPTAITPTGLAADSLGASVIGNLCWQAWQAGWIQANVVVRNESILQAQRWLWDELRTLVEPGGAAALSALLSGAYQARPGERVAVIVCGANCDPAQFAP